MRLTKGGCMRCLQMFVEDLMVALEQHPPPQPSQPAVDLLVSVGQQQKYLDANGLLPPAGHPGALDALQVGNMYWPPHDDQDWYLMFL